MPGGSTHRPGYVLAVFRRFGSAQGWGPAPPLGPEVAEAFVVAGLAGRAAATKGTYRSVLRSLGGSPRPARATPFSGSPAQAPYSSKESGELFAIAACQRQAWRRRSALALLALGIGAGLRAGELAAATGDDVVPQGEGVAVRVGPGRVVPVTAPYAKAVAELAEQAGPGYLFCPGGADRAYKNFVNNFCYGLVADPAAPRFSSGRARSSFICGHLAAGTPLQLLLYIAGIVEVESLLRYARHVPRGAGLQSRAAKEAAPGMNLGRQVPVFTSALSEEALCFCTEVIDSSGVAEGVEALLAKKTGRPRHLKVRAILVALLCLAIDDRPLHLKAATKLLYERLPASWRARLGIRGDASGRKAFLARYRQVRYLSHLVLSLIDPSPEPKDRVLPVAELAAKRKNWSEAEVATRQEALAKLVADLLGAAVEVCSADELSGFDGSVGLDATPVPLWSRGPSVHRGTAASDPDGGWYVREGDHREGTGPEGKAARKIYWALEATIVTMGRPPGAVPDFPNLALGLSLAPPGHDPGRAGTRLLAEVRRRGWPAGFLGADRGYTQCRPEHFHLPVRALGYSLVMDYKAAELGRQANSQGAVMVDGAFYCPAMPEDLVSASADKRAGIIDDAMYKARISARTSWRLVHKQGPDQDGYERFACPAQGEHPHLCCPLRPQANALGQVPVLSPPTAPPKICTQSAVTVAPDIGARHRQDLAFGGEEWAATYAAYRNTVEGWNGYVKGPAHEALAAPGRRRVRGIAAQSIFVTLLLMAGNFRKVAAFRQMVADRTAEKLAERARRRRVSLTDYRSPP